MIEYGKLEMEYVSQQYQEMEFLVNKYGHLERGITTDVFSSLVQHIVGQMLSIYVARTLNERLIKCVDKITPQNIIAIEESEIRNCGISSKKAAYIKQLAEDVNSGIYDFDLLNDMSDEEVVQYLTHIIGVGVWTAEMIAEFTLGRLNIFSFGDVALQNGIKKAHGYKTLSKQRFERLRKKYSPYCTAASLYYYALNDDKDIE